MKPSPKVKISRTAVTRRAGLGRRSRHPGARRHRAMHRACAPTRRGGSDSSTRRRHPLTLDNGEPWSVRRTGRHRVAWLPAAAATAAHRRRLRTRPRSRHRQVCTFSKTVTSCHGAGNVPRLTSPIYQVAAGLIRSHRMCHGSVRGPIRSSSKRTERKREN